ncbi:MAG: dihydrodipicolinate synthase family protein [Deltaproteobacteria bacterium]|nr:MAG: dihydrodipicolinate synthase family protein [Deltaproteobacteria bacterium]
MVQSVTPRGLIGSLALVVDPQEREVFRGLDSLIARLQPAVAGLLLDPMFWCPDVDHCGPVTPPLLEHVIRLVPATFPLWVRITGTTAEQTIQNRRRLETICSRLNYSGPLAWVDTPLLYHSNRGLPEHYRTLLAETPFNLIADNNPQLIGKLKIKTKRKNIRTAVLKRIAEEPRLVGLLHRGDLRRVMNYQRAVRRRSDFFIYDASERSFLERPSASGIVSVGANLLPDEWRAITLASLNLDEGSQSQSARFRHLWETGLKVRTLEKYYKNAPARIIPAVLAAWGLIRGQGEPLSPGEQKAVDSILAHLPEGRAGR